MRRIIFVALVAALTIWTTPANAITNGVHDGTQHPNVGALVAYEEDLGTYSFYCSGSLLDATHFLTAGHCVNNFLEYAWLYPLKDIFVTFDSNLRAHDAYRLIDPKHLIGVKAIDAHPAYLATGVTGPDVGVVTLATRVTGITPIELPDVGFLDRAAANGGLLGHVFVNVGYGTQGATMNSLENPKSQWLWDGYRWMSTSPFMALTPAYLKLLMCTEATGQGGVGYGDSGGPHFYSDDPDDPGYDLVVAVTAGVDPNLQAMGANTRLDTPIVLDWLETFM